MTERCRRARPRPVEGGPVSRCSPDARPCGPAAFGARAPALTLGLSRCKPSPPPVRLHRYFPNRTLPALRRAGIGRCTCARTTWHCHGPFSAGLHADDFDAHLGSPAAGALAQFGDVRGGAADDLGAALGRRRGGHLAHGRRSPTRRPHLRVSHRPGRRPIQLVGTESGRRIGRWCRQRLRTRGSVVGEGHADVSAGLPRGRVAEDSLHRYTTGVCCRLRDGPASAESRPGQTNGAPENVCGCPPLTARSGRHRRETGPTPRRRRSALRRMSTVVPVSASAAASRTSRTRADAAASANSGVWSEPLSCVIATNGGERPQGEGEPLARGAEADGTRALPLKKRPRPGHDQVHRGRPVTLDQAAVAADERPGQPVGRGVGLPAEQVLRPETTVVHAIPGASPYAGHATVHDRDVHRVPVGVQDRCGLHPSLHITRCDILRERGIHPGGPLPVPPVRGTTAPGFSDAVLRSVHAALPPSQPAPAAPTTSPVPGVARLQRQALRSTGVPLGRP